MDEFLSNNRKSRAIPVFVFYSDETKYITHFIERSATAHGGPALAMEQAKAKLNLPATATFGNLQDPERQLYLQEVISSIEPHADQWRRDVVREIRQLLGGSPAFAGCCLTKRSGIMADQSGLPIVYTIRGCDACVKLLTKWDAEGVLSDERRVELSQATLDEARKYGKLVPIVV